MNEKFGNGTPLFFLFTYTSLIIEGWCETNIYLIVVLHQFPCLLVVMCGGLSLYSHCCPKFLAGIF
jgi:hypothetical protein